eukprot:GFKZ01008057.1.p1 GENE.GFKZ01008057.1~~GFKZ01008057.1.p1  ORF type:complete len:194 (+),score=27.51 GFKZ01008057.1:137-718(+)
MASLLGSSVRTMPLPAFNPCHPIPRHIATKSPFHPRNAPVCSSPPLPTPLQTTLNRALHYHNLNISSTTWHPPTLTIYLSTPNPPVSADDCAKASNILGPLLEDAQFANGRPYTLQVSSEGVRDVLTDEREFTVFKGFPVRIVFTEQWKGKREVTGKLVGREAKGVRVGLGGRVLVVPAAIVAEVRLCTEREL